ncbi:MAG TPA: YibE/F family protein [Mycobacteriales bacterium]
MGSNHSHLPAGTASPRAVRSASIVLVVAGLITLVAVIWLWPGQPPRNGPAAAVPPAMVTGEVVSVDRSTCPDAVVPELAEGCGVTVRLTDGPDAGKRVTVDIPAGPGAPKVTAGDAVVLAHQPDSANGKPYQITDHRRGTQLWILVGAFVLAVLAFGRWRGLRALLGLAVSFAMLLLFIVPGILAGESPLLVAIVGSAAIMLAVLYLTNGVNVETSIAVLGTLAALALTGVLAAVFTGITHLTGIASDDASYISVTYPSVDMRGLLLAGILIGALGVLDDVTVTQAATVTELAIANPSYTPRQLYRAATRIGRAHIASVINTIILAYAGASLPVLLLLVAGRTPTGQLLTEQLMAQELVRSGVGTIGLITAVPITTALAALTARRTLAGDTVGTPRARHAAG